MNVADSSVPAVAGTTIALGDDDYPPLLREIHDPPRLLYVRGDRSFLLRPQLAIVGSRRASPAGLRLAEDLGARLAEAGLSICSGLALGIDGAAHRGAMAAGGCSVAVMATGIDRVYPQRHRALAEQLQQCGCLVTEFPPGTPPRRPNFPQRNRIISGLSLGVLVVEAALPSGSLITARSALEQGREVFALPWSMLHEGGMGCLDLLRDGAKMVRNVEDVLEELGPLYTLHQESTEVGPVAPEEHALLACVGFEVTSLEQLVQSSGEPVSRVLGELSAMELRGQVARVSGGYIRC